MLKSWQASILETLSRARSLLPKTWRRGRTPARVPATRLAATSTALASVAGERREFRPGETLSAAGLPAGFRDHSASMCRNPAHLSPELRIVSQCLHRALGIWVDVAAAVVVLRGENQIVVQGPSR